MQILHGITLRSALKSKPNNLLKMRTKIVLQSGWNGLSATRLVWNLERRGERVDPVPEEPPPAEGVAVVVEVGVVGGRDVHHNNVAGEEDDDQDEDDGD